MFNLFFFNNKKYLYIYIDFSELFDIRFYAEMLGGKSV
tara:strand:+ start:725 stop:838 length:114 start_codon:yes stop_codon:yes gene_type:complete